MLVEAGCEELVPLVDGGELRLAHDGELFHEAEPPAVGGGVVVGVGGQGLPRDVERKVAILEAQLQLQLQLLFWGSWRLNTLSSLSTLLLLAAIILARLGMVLYDSWTMCGVQQENTRPATPKSRGPTWWPWRSSRMG